MAIRVEALSNTETSYSVKKLDGTNVDALNWTFNWSILHQTSNEEYGTITGLNNQEFVYVNWKSVLPGTELIDRELSCEITIKNSAGEEICKKLIEILVRVTDDLNDLTVGIDGIDGSSIGYTGYIAGGNTAVLGPVQLTNQCHLLGNTMSFYATGSTGVTNFWWTIQPPVVQNSNGNGGGIFNYPENNNASSMLVTADGSHSSIANALWTNTPPVPPSDGCYYVKVEGADNGNKLSNPKYLKFKLCPTNPIIISNAVPTSINIGYAPIYFNWTIKNLNIYPEWFKFKAMLEIGELNCQPQYVYMTGPDVPTGWYQVGTACYGINDVDYTGTNWLSGTMIELVNKPIYEMIAGLTGNSLDYTFGYTVSLPSYFRTGWLPGDPDRYRFKLHSTFWDEAISPSATGPCVATKDQVAQDIILEHCPIPPPYSSSIAFKGPTCPTAFEPKTVLWTKIPIETVYTEPCPTGQIWNGLLCEWPIGATTPCYAITGQYWNGTECVCAPGYTVGPTGCVVDIVVGCPTGATMLDGSCTCTEYGMIMDISSGGCTCDPDVYNNPCLVSVDLDTGAAGSICSSGVSNYGINLPLIPNMSICSNSFWIYNPNTFTWTNTKTGYTYSRYTITNCASVLLAGDEIWYDGSMFLNFAPSGLPFIAYKATGTSLKEYTAQMMTACVFTN